MVWRCGKICSRMYEVSKEQDRLAQQANEVGTNANRRTPLRINSNRLRQRITTIRKLQPNPSCYRQVYKSTELYSNQNNLNSRGHTWFLHQRHLETMWSTKTYNFRLWFAISFEIPKRAELKTQYQLMSFYSSPPTDRRTQCISSPDTQAVPTHLLLQ